MKKIAMAMAAAAFGASTAAAEPVPVTLADYAFDFPTYGYEIEISGSTKNVSDSLNANDYITIRDGGHRIKALIDRMERKDRQGFISFFNEHCVTGFGGERCLIEAAGDIELDDEMKMIFRVVTATISKGAEGWSNANKTTE